MSMNGHGCSCRSMAIALLSMNKITKRQLEKKLYVASLNKMQIILFYAIYNTFEYTMVYGELSVSTEFTTKYSF